MFLNYKLFLLTTNGRNFRNNILISLFHSLLSTKIRMTSENKAYLFAPFLHDQPVKEREK